MSTGSRETAARPAGTDWSPPALSPRADSVPDVIVYLPLSGQDLYAGSREVEGCGGCMVLLLLVDELNALGVRAVAYPFNHDGPGPALAEALASGRTMVVYPEAVRDNPLGARRVVRWVLYHAPVEALRAWRAAGDLVVSYWPHFLPLGEGAPALRLLDAGVDFFRDLGRPRLGVGVRVGKGRDYHPGLHEHSRRRVLEALGALSCHSAVAALHRRLARNPWQAEILPDRLTRQELLEGFNCLALFISYDNDSATSCLAALCGCPSLIVPRPALDPVQLQLPPCYRYGVAYGWQAMPHALDTMHLLASDLQALQAEGRGTVRALLRAVREQLGVDLLCTDRGAG